VRADPLGGIGRQYGHLRSGIEQKGYRGSIREQCDDRRIVQHRNRRLA
jgi:hypothetical protein